VEEVDICAIELRIYLSSAKSKKGIRSKINKMKKIKDNTPKTLKVRYKNEKKKTKLI
jgi:hypothetical protein